MPEPDRPPSRHHLLIAGTGRAGTSFLVRWLAAAGLQTHLATHDSPIWDEDANAGLEDLPVVADWKTAPYVMKSPWLTEVVDDLLVNPRLVLDAVIIPMRDLAEAATSRVVQELQTAHRRNPWMAGLSRSFEQWGTTPGGVVYSLDPLDQARLLAMSFHHLLQRLVQADVPVVLLDFPRLALDADYLFGKLRRFVPITRAKARAAHAALADPDKIRVGRELAAAPAAEAECSVHQHVDGMAMRRELLRLGNALATAEREAAARRAEIAALRVQLEAQAATQVPPGSEPVVPATEPALPATEPGVPATEAGVPATEPAVLATEPDVPATEPGFPASEPAVAATEPAVLASESAAAAAGSAAPVTESGVPASESAVPATEPAEPAAEFSVPATETTVLATDPAIPASESAVPATEPAIPVTKPAVPATEPAAPATEPAVSATEPAVLATKPAIPATGRPPRERRTTPQAAGRPRVNRAP